MRVAFCLDTPDRLESIALEGSTGSSMLDRAARECVVQTALPLARTGCFTLPVRFAR